MPHSQIWIPTVIEKTGRGERAYDIYSRLLEDRIVFVGTPINDTVANIVIAQLLFLQKDNKNQEISLYINSPGGYVSDGLAIYDTMQFISCDIATFCIGQAMSMGALLLAAGSIHRTSGILINTPTSSARIPSRAPSSIRTGPKNPCRAGTPTHPRPAARC